MKDYPVRNLIITFWLSVGEEIILFLVLFLKQQMMKSSKKIIVSVLSNTGIDVVQANHDLLLT